MACHRCGRSVAHIQLDLRDAEEPAAMQSCSTCGTVTWICDGRAVDRRVVLARLAPPRRSNAAG